MRRIARQDGRFVAPNMNPKQNVLCAHSLHMSHSCQSCCNLVQQQMAQLDLEVCFAQAIHHACSLGLWEPASKTLVACCLIAIELHFSFPAHTHTL